MASLVFEGLEIAAEDGDTVLSALLRAGKAVQHQCQVGACQACLLQTKGEVPSAAQAGLDDELAAKGAFLACQAKAGSTGPVERLAEGGLPRRHAVIVGKKMISHDVLFLSLEVEGFPRSPGRFVRLVHPSGASRPYSVATPANSPEDRVDLHVRLIPGGEMSELLCESEIGDAYMVEGPLGKCVYRSENREEPILMIGSGTGLAPLYAIAQDALSKGHRGEIHLYHGAAVPEGLYFRQELGEMESKHAGFFYVSCCDTRATGSLRVGSPLDHALAEHPDLTGWKVYICGHPGLVQAAKKKCFLAGANLKDIAADSFAPANK